jgi:regulator of cell morphogenesis and NO signaling
MATQSAPPALQNLSLRELADYVVDKHHTYLRNELPALEQRLSKMCSNHGQDRPELFTMQQHLQDLRDDLTAHLGKEEMVLFPYIRQLEEARERGLPHPTAPFPSVRFPVRMMLMEHDGAEELLLGLRSASGNYQAPAGLCDCGREFYSRLAALDADLVEHIRIENDILFPRAIHLEEMGK